MANETTVRTSILRTLTQEEGATGGGPATHAAGVGSLDSARGIIDGFPWSEYERACIVGLALRDRAQLDEAERLSWALIQLLEEMNGRAFATLGEIRAMRELAICGKLSEGEGDCEHK